MPIVQLDQSPLAPNVSPVDIHVRDLGPPTGFPVVLLHGGRGYEFYPFDRQIAAMPEYRIIAPDRSGYGKSTPIHALPPRFHDAAAAETEAVLDKLGVTRCCLWGHSDG